MSGVAADARAAVSPEPAALSLFPPLPTEQRTAQRAASAQPPRERGLLGRGEGRLTQARKKATQMTCIRLLERARQTKSQRRREEEGGGRERERERERMATLRISSQNPTSTRLPALVVPNTVSFQPSNKFCLQRMDSMGERPLVLVLRWHGLTLNGRLPSRTCSMRAAHLIIAGFRGASSTFATMQWIATWRPDMVSTFPLAGRKFCPCDIDWAQKHR